MLRSKIVPIALTAAIAIGGSGLALGTSNHKEAGEAQEIAAVMSAKTSLAQAIAAAEQQTGGKAVSAAYDGRDGTKAYEVEVATGSTLQKVLVDPDTGKVTKTTAANGENEQDGDQDKD